MIKKRTNPYLKQKTSNNKYGAKKAKIDGITFDSIAEAKYYLFMKSWKEKGIVKDFEMQKTFELQPRFEHPIKKTKNGKPSIVGAIKFTPDFVVTYKDGTVKVVDVKGMVTRDFKIRSKMFMHKYGIPIYIAKLDSRSGMFSEKEF